MRICPKCQTEYDDADLRTICSACLVSLVRAGEAQVEAPAPVAVPETGTDAAVFGDPPPAPVAERDPIQAKLQAKLQKPKYWIHGCLALFFLAAGAATYSGFAHFHSALGLLPIAAILLALLVRRLVFAFTVKAVQITPLATPALGMTLPVQMAFAFRRPVCLGPVAVTLTAHECAVRSNGDGETRFRYTVYQHADTLLGHIGVAARSHALIAELPIPWTAPPTFDGHPNQIYWEVILQAKMPGWLPAIREDAIIRVRPQRVDAAPLPAQTRQFAVNRLEGLPGVLTLACPVGESGTPMIPIGRPVPFTLEITPEASATTQRMRVELVYRVEGPGDAEEREVASVIVFPEGWTSGRHTAAGTLLLPPDAPVTFKGRRMRIHWVLRVRHQVLWHRDYAQNFAATVVPADGSAQLPPDAKPPDDGTLIFKEALAFITGRGAKAGERPPDA